MQDAEAGAYELGDSGAEPGEGGGLFDLLGVVGRSDLVPLNDVHDGYAVGEVGAFEMHCHVTPLSRVCRTEACRISTHVRSARGHDTVCLVVIFTQPVVGTSYRLC